MNDIPVIDLESQFEDSNAELRIAQNISYACERIGFFAVSGHGVPEKIIENCLEVSREFFSYDEVEKLKLKMPFKGYPYGFAPMETETLSHSRGQQSPPDLKENFSVGPNLSIPSNISNEEALFVFSKNQWPLIPKEFRRAWEAYYSAMSQLSIRIMNLFAISLNLPKDYFEEFIRCPISALRANYYPVLEQSPLPSQMRAGAHSDYGSITLLIQEEEFSGLEILNAKKKWIPVKPCKPKIIVNLGDLMQHWTNGRWMSTLHRVKVPDVNEKNNKTRVSLAFFQQPDWDARIECIPTCLDPGEKSKYSIVTSGRYLMERFHSTVL